MARGHPRPRRRRVTLRIDEDALFYFAELADEWFVLQSELKRVALQGYVLPGRDGPYGQKYEVRATIRGPNGARAFVNTVWIVNRGQTVPRFVTAYPWP